MSQFSRVNQVNYQMKRVEKSTKTMLDDLASPIPSPESSPPFRSGPSSSSSSSDDSNWRGKLSPESPDSELLISRKVLLSTMPNVAHVIAPDIAHVIVLTLTSNRDYYYY